MFSGVLVVDIAGHALTAEDRELLRHPLVGGVILFTRNYASRGQLIRLVSEIHGLREPHLLVTVDHEGGPVQRFQSGFTRLPSMSQLGLLYRHDRGRALRLTQEVGWLLAAELRECGVDHSFTPVLDLEREDSTVLRFRTFHHDGQVVAELARCLMAGLQEGGMQATGKHFPGHGGVSGDSHEVLPVDTRCYEDIYAQDILPFERMIRDGLASVMPAHVIYEQVDSLPAGFSAVWIQDVLRRRLAFEGVVVSDDLSMAGACQAGGYTERAEAAQEAGCDVLLICNNRPGAIEVAEHLRQQQSPARQARMERVWGRRTAAPEGDLRLLPRWQGVVGAIGLLQDQFPLSEGLG